MYHPHTTGTGDAVLAEPGQVHGHNQVVAAHTVAIKIGLAQLYSHRDLRLIINTFNQFYTTVYQES